MSQARFDFRADLLIGFEVVRQLVDCASQMANLIVRFIMGASCQIPIHDGLCSA